MTSARENALRIIADMHYMEMLDHASLTERVFDGKVAPPQPNMESLLCVATELNQSQGEMRR